MPECAENEMRLLPVIHATRENRFGFDQQDGFTVVEVRSELVGEQPSCCVRTGCSHGGSLAVTALRWRATYRQLK